MAEALLVLVVITLGTSVGFQGDDKPTVTEVGLKANAQRAQDPEANPDKAEQPKAEQPRAANERPAQEQQRPPVPEQADRPQPAPPVAQPRPQPSPAFIPLSPAQMARADEAVRSAPPAKAGPPRGPMGPPNLGGGGSDSQRVGSAPNGQPMYAASWYREPYDDELRGYLSTATGPGWGLIACRTAPDYRVENCVGLDEYPTGSNITRAVLAAAWQFKVRPPRIGGQEKIGEWVRIRIDYGQRRR